MNYQENCNKLKPFLKLGLIRILFWNWAEKTLGSAWKTKVGRVSGNNQLFFTPKKWKGAFPINRKLDIGAVL